MTRNYLQRLKNHKKNYRITRKLIGLSPQELNFDVFFPIKKVLEFQAGYYGLSHNKAKERTEMMLEQFGLTDKKNNSCRELSGGMKRRLQIAKALIHNPEILILDEPTAGVDIELRYMLWDFLKKINQEGKTILLTTHYIEEAENLCDRIAILNKGKLVALDTTKNLIDKIKIKKIIFRLNKKIDLSKFESAELKFLSNINNEIIISYNKEKIKIEEIIKLIKNEDVEILDISTDEADLEDVFIEFTKS